MQELARPHEATGIASQQAKLIARFTTGQGGINGIKKRVGSNLGMLSEVNCLCVCWVNRIKES